MNEEQRKALAALAEMAFGTVLDVDVVTRNRETGEEKKEVRSFVPLEQAAALREGLREALKGLNHYRDTVKARIMADSLYQVSDLEKMDDSGPESGEKGPNHAR